MQNVQRGPLRTCFLPAEPGRKLIVADLKQVQMLIAALFAPDPVMLQGFRAGKDMHLETASAVRKKDLRDVGGDRQLAKAVNFGFLFLQKGKGFQRYAMRTYEVRMSLQEAELFRRRFFERYCGLARWHAQIAEEARTVRKTYTAYGRLLVPKTNSHWNVMQMLCNYRDQGSEADAIKLAMVKIAAFLPSDCYWLATVHDEIVIDAPADIAGQLAGMIRIAMEEAFREIFGDAPIKADVKICDNWGEK
jgi:DNA polymerase I-like protein with 3'-5' exonuclease and polymerase domains